ncbi:hypothetical protein ABAC460_00855 [Asticcacaulis sp. AC460]|nr:hypothetical protein ABAC460_00855 [Asticcacaulis sp. AC460]
MAVGCLVTTPAFAGAFGIEMGTPLSQLKDPDLMNGSGPVKTYYVTAPQPNSEFERYVVTLTTQTGVCSVVGFGRLYDNDRYGNAVRPPYERLKSVLTTKYGPPVSDQYALLPDALWNKDSDFAASIYRKERVVAVGWRLDERPGNMNSVTMMISSNADDTTSVTIAYGFKNYDKCNQIAEQSDNSGL